VEHILLSKFAQNAMKKQQIRTLLPFLRRTSMENIEEWQKITKNLY
jgi:hypothetical protein